MVVRVTETFLILYFIEEGVSGFELVDKKELYDSISFIATPALFLACCNLRVNVFTTVPMTLFCTVYVMQLTLSKKDGNLSCYVKTDGFANTMSGK